MNHPAFSVTPDSPLLASAALLVGVLLAAHPWADPLPPSADMTVAADARRPRRTPDEKHILNYCRQVRERAAWHRERERERAEQFARTEERERFRIACGVVGVKFHLIAIPAERMDPSGNPLPAPSVPIPAGYAERRAVQEAEDAHPDELRWAIGSNSRKEKVFFS